MRFFSSRQVVAILVTICATVILMPTAVWAASSSLVRVTDGNGHIAKVVKGKLVVGDGKGAMTVDGTVKVANQPHSMKVSGTVNARPVSPAQPWNTVNGVDLSAADSSKVMYQGTVGTRINLTSFTAAADGGTAGIVRSSCRCT
jgi:hypothetical protein